MGAVMAHTAAMPWKMIATCLMIAAVLVLGWTIVVVAWAAGQDAGLARAAAGWFFLLEALLVTILGLLVMLVEWTLGGSDDLRARTCIGFGVVVGLLVLSQLIAMAW